jgi:hypothetical protein
MKAYRFTFSVDEDQRLITFKVVGAIPSAILVDKFIEAYRTVQYKVAVVSNDALEHARPSTTRHLFAEDIRAFSSMTDALKWLGVVHYRHEDAAVGADEEG